MSEKILLLADSNSSHIENWAISLAKKGYEVGIFSLNTSDRPWHNSQKNISILYEPSKGAPTLSLTDKLKYFFVLPKLWQTIKNFEPDILHAHYASSYGILGALSGFHPFLLSAWGSDVFEFPNKSLLHKLLLSYNFRKSDMLLSTSHALKKEMEKYTGKPIEITPFGVDTSLFRAQEVKSEPEKDYVYIGAIKAIEDQYGLQTVIPAIGALRKSMPDLKFKVLLIGAGSKLNYYKEWVEELGLSQLIRFPGKIPFSKIAHFHNLLDIFINVSSVNESFGVSVLEAMACEKPVIVSNASGLEEIVKPGTGQIISKNNSEQLLLALRRLIEDPGLAAQMGKQGRRHVLENYPLERCVNIMSSVYEKALTSSYHARFQYRLASRRFI